MRDWSTARPDWADRIASQPQQSLLPDGLPIDRKRADKALRIFRRLRIYDIPGQPTMEEVCPPWQIDLVEAIFGCYDAETRRQLVREFLVCVAKKNGKSSLAAGIMLTALVLHSRHGEEFLILSPTKDIADNSFTVAYHMVKLDPELLKRFKPSETTRDIINRLDGSILAVKSADADVVGGQKATSVLVDELWLFGKKSSAKNILSEATGSHAARPEGFALYLTTQSDDPPAGVFKDMLHYYRRIRDGETVDRSKLAMIYEYPVEMQKDQAWLDPATWHIPNPSIGRSVDREWLATKLAEENDKGTDSLRLFCAKHFNVEIGIGLRTDRWVGAEHWLAATEPGLTLDSILARCDVCTIGIDGGGLDDLLGLAIIGREKETRRWLHWGHAWLHRGGLERRKSEAQKYHDLEQAGDLTIFDDLGGGEGEVGDDVSQVVDYIERVRDAKLLPVENGIGVDPVGISAVIDELERRKISTKESKLIASCAQGWALTNSIKDAERRLAAKTLRHCGQDIMTWSAGNAKVEPRGNAITITKQAAGTAKIDPLMAFFNSVKLMALNPAAGRKVTAKSLLVV